MGATRLTFNLDLKPICYLCCHSLWACSAEETAKTVNDQGVVQSLKDLSGNNRDASLISNGAASPVLTAKFAAANNQPMVVLPADETAFRIPGISSIQRGSERTVIKTSHTSLASFPASTSTCNATPMLFNLRWRPSATLCWLALPAQPYTSFGCVVNMIVVGTCPCAGDHCPPSPHRPTNCR